MTEVVSAARSICRLAGLALAGVVMAVAARPAFATLCTEFTLTEVQVAVFENGSWSHTAFQQNGAGQFMVARNPDWPSTVSLIMRWDINPGAHPEILPAASLAPLPVFLDYQYAGDGFGTSFGAVAQINNVSMTVGSSRPLYFEMGLYLPNTGCDLIRSNIATLVVTPWLHIDQGNIPDLVCQGPGCDPLFQRPGDILINPGFIQQIQPGAGRSGQQQAQPGQRGEIQSGQIQPGQIQPGQIQPGQVLPQLQFRQ